MESHRAKRASLNPDDALLANRYAPSTIALLRSLTDIVALRHVGQVYDPAIMAYRPQKTPLPFTASVSWDSADFYAASRPEYKRSSTSSYASFGSTFTTVSATQTNATSLGSRRSSFTTVQQRTRSTQPPPPLFKRLPTEVYECILRQLSDLHTGAHLQSCATCYLRDLYNLALVSRAWDRAVRIQL